MVEGLLEFVTALESDMSDITEHIFVAHNMTKFDLMKIRELFTRAQIEIPENWVFVDSLLYCKFYAP